MLSRAYYSQGSGRVRASAPSSLLSAMLSRRRRTKDDKPVSRNGTDDAESTLSPTMGTTTTDSTNSLRTPSTTTTTTRNDQSRQGRHASVPVLPPNLTRDTTVLISTENQQCRRHRPSHRRQPRKSSSSRSVLSTTSEASSQVIAQMWSSHSSLPLAKTKTRTSSRTIARGRGSKGTWQSTSEKPPRQPSAFPSHSNGRLRNKANQSDTTSVTASSILDESVPYNRSRKVLSRTTTTTSRESSSLLTTTEASSTPTLEDTVVRKKVGNKIIELKQQDPQKMVRSLAAPTKGGGYHSFCVEDEKWPSTSGPYGGERRPNLDRLPGLPPTRVTKRNIIQPKDEEKQDSRRPSVQNMIIEVPKKVDHPKRVIKTDPVHDTQVQKYREANETTKEDPKLNMVIEVPVSTSTSTPPSPSSSCESDRDDNNKEEARTRIREACARLLKRAVADLSSEIHVAPQNKLHGTPRPEVSC